MVVANGDDDPASLLTVCAKGFGKRTALTEYRSQNRGGKGLIDIKTTDRNGPVVAIAKVTDADEVMLTTTGGILIRTPVADMRLIGRNTQGVRLIRVEEGDSVSSLAKLPEEELAANVELEADVDADAADGPPACPPTATRPTSSTTASPRPRPATTSTRAMSIATASPRCEDDRDGQNASTRSVTAVRDDRYLVSLACRRTCRGTRRNGLAARRGTRSSGTGAGATSKQAQSVDRCPSDSLIDGTEVEVIWSWLSQSRRAILVTVYFRD